MELAHPRSRRLATRSAHRALVIVALCFNALIPTFVLADGDLEGALGVAVLAAPPAVLLALVRFPLAFRLLAAVLGIVYASMGVVAFFFGGALFVVAALCLLTAAVLPGVAPGPAARRQRRVIYLGTLAGLAFVLAAGLVLLAL